MVKFYVVTRTDCSDTAVAFTPLGMCYLPVFEKGEILILDSSYGREIGYPGRKPSKWGVEGREFDDLTEAIETCQQVLREANTDAGS